MFFKNFKIKTTPTVFSLALALFYFFCLNVALISKLHDISKTTAMSWGFEVSVPVLLVSAFNLIFLPFSGTRARKPLFIFLTILSAVLSYATFNYGVIFSREMIVNIVETDMAESSSFFTFSAAAWILFLGIMPAWIIYRTDVRTGIRQAWMQMLSAAISIGLIAGVVSAQYQDYVITMRNNSDLKKIVVPTYALNGVYKFVKGKYFTKPVPFVPVATDARLIAPPGQKNLVVLVIGEAARAKNYSLNGYHRDTNRYTSAQNVIFFKNVTSCGTETAVSVPCMFSNLARAGYSIEKAQARDNLMDILARAGVETSWIENDGGCKGVCKNVPTVDIREIYKADKDYCSAAGCHDGAILPEFKKQLSMLKKDNSVIVIHLMGSHGPAYYMRYPAAHEAYSPVCAKSDIQNCPADAIINTYDNTILYADFVISEIIKTLQTQSRPAMLLYLSDHGESLGENGVYLHGLPYQLAPEEQKHIPMISWLSPAWQKRNNIDAKCLSKKAETGGYSQDNLFPTMLGLAQVQTAAYDATQDIFASCRGK